MDFVCGWVLRRPALRSAIEEIASTSLYFACFVEAGNHIDANMIFSSSQ
jgi:hypothetical protein